MDTVGLKCQRVLNVDNLVTWDKSVLVIAWNHLEVRFTILLNLRKESILNQNRYIHMYILLFVYNPLYLILGLCFTFGRFHINKHYW